MSLKKEPGRGRIAHNRGIFDELVVMILILILNIIKIVNRKFWVGLNLRELPRKIPDWEEFPHVFRENPRLKWRILRKMWELIRFPKSFTVKSVLELLQLPNLTADFDRIRSRKSLEFKGNSYVDLAKRPDLNPLGEAAGNVSNVG